MMVVLKLQNEASFSFMLKHTGCTGSKFPHEWNISLKVLSLSLQKFVKNSGVIYLIHEEILDMFELSEVNVELFFSASLRFADNGHDTFWIEILEYVIVEVLEFWMLLVWKVKRTIFYILIFDLFPLS